MGELRTFLKRTLSYSFGWETKKIMTLLNMLHTCVGVYLRAQTSWLTYCELSLDKRNKFQCKMAIIWVTKLSIFLRVAASIFHEPLLYGRTRTDPREHNIRQKMCPEVIFQRIFNPFSSPVSSTTTHLCLQSTRGGLCGSDGRESACNARDLGSIPGSGRFPGEGNGNPLQYSCLDRGAWWATLHDVTNSWTHLSD